MCHVDTHTHTHTPSYIGLCSCCCDTGQIHFQCPLLFLGASLSVVLDALGSETPDSVDTLHCTGESAADKNGLQGWMHFWPRRCSLPEDSKCIFLFSWLLFPPPLVLILGLLLLGLAFSVDGLCNILHFLLPCNMVLCLLTPVVLSIKATKVGANDVIPSQTWSPKWF